MAMLLVDIGLNLNTVKLSDGKSFKTRLALLMEYLRSEFCFDAIMVVYNILDSLDNSEQLDVIMHLIVLATLVIRFQRKGELLRTYFTFKKYMNMIDSVLILIAFGHFSVPLG